MERKSFMEEFMKYRFLLKELTVKKIKLQYRNSVLGMFWSFLQPLLTMIVISFVFGSFFGRDSSKVVNYPVYLLCGKLIHSFFTGATKGGMKSIRSHAAILKKVCVPKYIYTLSAVLSEFVSFLISLSVLVVVILFFNIMGINPITVTWKAVLAIIPIIVLLLFSMGVGLILATLNVFFKDVENIYDVFSLLLFYATPIVYTFDRLDYGAGSWQLNVLKLNPLYGFVEMFRGAVLYGGEFTEINAFLYSCVVTLVVLVIGVIVFRKNQDKFILHV